MMVVTYCLLMASASYDIVSRRTRRVFRDLAAGVAYRAIAEYWQDEGFEPDPTADTNGASGVRRATFDSFATKVDWTDLRQADRALRVFENLLRYCRRQQGHEPGHFDEIREVLAEDGLALDVQCKIHWSRNPGLQPSLAALNDGSGIRAELERVRRALPDDPAGAIGAAKQLVEATAKVVLQERGRTVNEKADVPDLIKEAQQALNLHPSSVVAGPDGADAIKKILGGVSAIAIGIAELRNRGYGSGHGQARTPAGLGVRHAHLAVNAAITWCQILLDTLADPAAPWRGPELTHQPDGHRQPTQIHQPQPDLEAAG